MQTALVSLNRVASRLSLPMEFRERAAFILRRAVAAKLARGRSMDALAAASVYVAARDLGIPRSLREVARAAEVPIGRLSSATKLVARRTGILTQAPQAADFVDRIASDLHLGSLVVRRALLILSNRKDRIAEPLGLAAGALYLAAKIEGVKVRQSELASVAGTSEVTLRRYYKSLQREADETFAGM